MAGNQRAGGSQGPRGPKGPKVGAIVTGMVVGHVKKGVVVELGSTELVLARSRVGTSVDRIEGSSYGDAFTVEVAADPERRGGLALTRVGIDRSLRQPRPIEGRLRREGAGFMLAPADGSPAFAAFVLDRLDPDSFDGVSTAWLVGAPYRDLRFVQPDPGSAGPALA